MVPQQPQPSLTEGRLWASCSRVTLSMYWLMTSSRPAQKAAEASKKAEAEDVLKKLLASGVSADEILEKLK